MKKIIFSFLILLVVIAGSFILFLSYIGLETSKFDYLIKNKVNEVNKKIKVGFYKTRIYLDVRDLKLIVKIQNPKILLLGNEIILSKLDLFVSLKSLYSSEFALEKTSIAFKENSIKDITKITRVFLPKIINRHLSKIFLRGSLEGEFMIPFNKDGSINPKYKFYGKILNAKINLNKDYQLNNFNSDISYGNKLNNLLTIKVNQGSISNINLSKSIINIEFQDNNKFVETSIQTQGNIKFKEIKNIFELFGFKLTQLKNIELTSNLTTALSFNIKNNLKIKDLKYKTEGILNKLYLKTDEIKKIKDVLPDFSSEITFKNTKLNFSNNIKNQTLKLDGNIKFSNSYEKVKILGNLNKKKNIYNYITSLTLNESKLNIPQLNYKKEKKKLSNINFNLDYIIDKYFLINKLIYVEGKNNIKLNNIKLNKKFEIINFESIKITTHKSKLKNNDFLINKKNKILISGKVFDAEPLIKSLYKKSENKTFSKNFNNDIEANIDKIVFGTNDDVFKLRAVASIKKGSFNKLSLKGNFSDNEIIEMSIYQTSNNTKTIQVLSDRARPFVKNFDFIEGFERGTLEYESIVTKHKSQSNLIIADFKVSKVPVLAQLFTLASLKGIADTLSGEGISFDLFEMKSNSEGNVMNIEDALATGPAVSILLDGYIDKGNIVSLSGTLVPATKLNSIIASIPVVGGILVGKKTGEGVVGVSFKMKGPPKDIKTTVNPIKTLTPRFIVRAVENMKKKKNK